MLLGVINCINLFGKVWHYLGKLRLYTLESTNSTTRNKSQKNSFNTCDHLSDTRMCVTVIFKKEIPNIYLQWYGK